ncbi:MULTISPECIES: AbiTii domain-containing protein [unclassified Rhodococcus (in: high G+C Gram-positive bacteria)]|uniref:AbiTii domain-containing protein n=1 Tax=unclassified Rhodococcus (in: high G+C Gram-positive bacteria) TaxID=192944 RepID=UPI0007BC1088|nr:MULTISPECIES: hypothetical protein [unclassified Rhodococcus (in: high G+C Gram-positive bacteria)]KZF06323.1 hypothetical protein A2J02_22025 [Rhodococcus sp. EPR-147]KZF09031.1 hypothetical protein A2J04_22555 [Rhodococcus sp. EPR-279]
MTNDSLLGDLRSRVLDEDAPVAGLLRTCVMLGSSTGSTGLRSWAQAELRGYGDGVDLPEYRQMHLPLFMDTQNGPLFRRGEQISVFSLPEEAREFVSGPVQFRQSIQELVELSDAQDSSIAITRPGLAEAAMLWSGRLSSFQQVDRIYYQVNRAAVAGIVDIVRTTLVELVADITTGVPMNELPSGTRVDAAVSVNVYGSQDNNSISVGTNSGVIGQGTASSQSQTNGVASEDLAALIRELRAAAEEVDDHDDVRADVDQAITDFESSVSGDSPDPAVVGRRVSMLRRLGDSIGGALLAALSSEGARLALAAVGVAA